MADFGKLNFATAFAPSSAFPLDARSYFESLAAAEAAAAMAVEVGSADSVYHFGETLSVVENGKADFYVIQPDKTLKKVEGIQSATVTKIEVVSEEVSEPDPNTLYIIV